MSIKINVPLPLPSEGIYRKLGDGAGRSWPVEVGWAEAYYHDFELQMQQSKI